MNAYLGLAGVVLMAVGCGGQADLGGTADGGTGSNFDGAPPTLDHDATTETHDGHVAQVDASQPRRDAADTQPFACTVTSTSSLNGVSLVFRAPVDCSFSVAQAQAGISIPYDLIIDSDVDAVTPKRRAGSACEEPGATGLIVFEQLTGGNENYCRCDEGDCPGSVLATKTLHAGTTPFAFSWHGRNWQGPSDTSNPEGAAFPPGDYVLAVRATGTHAGTDFEVAATLDIHLSAIASSSAELTACASGCATAAGNAVNGCPSLLTYGCLAGPCGASASGDLCHPAGTTAASTILCAQSALSTCPTACQSDATCMAFVACIEACPGPPIKCCRKGGFSDLAATCSQGICTCLGGYTATPYGAICN